METNAPSDHPRPASDTSKDAPFQLIKGILAKGGALLGLRIAGVFFSLIATIVITRTLEPKDFGLLAFAMASSSLCSLFLSLNIEAGSPAFVTRAIARNERLAANSFMYFSLLLTGTISIVFAALCIVVLSTGILARADAIASFELGSPFWVSTIMATIAQAFSRVLGRFGGALFHQIKAQGPRSFVQPFSFFVLALLFHQFAHNGLTISLSMFAFALSHIAALLVQTVLLRLRLTPIEFAPPIERKKWFATAVRLSPAVLIYENAAHFTIFAASFAIGATDIAILAVCIRIAALLRFSLTAIETTTMPKVAHEASHNNTKKTIQIIDIATALRLSIVTPAVIIGGLFSLSILGVFNPEYRSGSTALFIVLLQNIIFAVFGPGLSMLVALDRDQYSTRPLFSGVLFVGGGFYFGGIFGGLSGCALGGLIGWFLLEAWLYLVVKRTTQFDPSLIGIAKRFTKKKPNKVDITVFLFFALPVVGFMNDGHAKPPTPEDYELILREDFDTLKFTRASDQTGGLWAPVWKFGPYTSYIHPSSMDALTAFPGITDKSGTPLTLNPFSVDNGILTIKAGVIPISDKARALALVRTGDPSVQPSKDDLQYFTGTLALYDAWSSKHGYFEMRARLPRGQGFWPAFWLTGTKGWPPEIDILEAVYDENKRRNENVVHTTLHYKSLRNDDNEATRSKFNVHERLGANIYKDFHTYAAAWSANDVIFYFDGIEIFRANTPPRLEAPMYAILNLLIGARRPDPYWAMDVRNPSIFRETMEVDYIEIYINAVDASTARINPDRNGILNDTNEDDVISSGDHGSKIFVHGGLDHIFLGAGADIITVQDVDDAHKIIYGFNTDNGDRINAPPSFFDKRSGLTEPIVQVGDDVWIMRGATDKQAPQTIILRGTNAHTIRMNAFPEEMPQ
ncbi:MAG: family 16 glycosylhydrolase [Pseudomonadota bacterium]